ncbi:hypothetical protein F0562_009898 [Nyssa sinensis]|uniref:Uncharacterized protein n=1 Tax=Nyssa sinensis TaxID=561372 RepID=A0A5J4ZXD9_9ASTE|nr:hypothetical protein F0562_009898 [Nyssa sinensis]
MAICELVTGGAACALPGSSSSSNPLCALANALIASSSKLSFLMDLVGLGGRFGHHDGEGVLGENSDDTEQMHMMRTVLQRLPSEAVLALEAEVFRNPDNAEGWRLLGIAHAENDNDQQIMPSFFKLCFGNDMLESQNLDDLQKEFHFDMFICFRMLDE